MPTNLDMVPAIASDSLTTPTSLRISTALVRPGFTPGTMSNGDVMERLKASGPGDSVIALSPSTRKALVTDEQSVIDVADALTADKSVLLTASNLGNSTHEWTNTGDTLADVFGAGTPTTDFAAAVLDTRKPKLPVSSLVDKISDAALAGGKDVLIVVNRQDGTVRVLTDTANNIATKYAALIAAKGSEGAFVAVAGTEPAAAGASVVYLN